MGHSWISVVGWGLIISTCAFAWIKGAAAERWGALWVLIMYLASDAAIALADPVEPQVALFALDFLLAAGLLVLAIRYSSLWLGMAMMLQAAALCAHAFRLVGEGLSNISWMILNNLISVLMLVCIVIATAISWRTRRKPAKSPAFILVSDAPAN